MARAAASKVTTWRSAGSEATNSATTAAVAKDFKVFYQKVPGKTPGNYTMDHSAGTYVFDPQGRLRLFVRPSPSGDNASSLDRLVSDIRLLLAGN
jgi:protein SCO1/2